MNGSDASTTDQAFFEAKYAGDPAHDPWRFATDRDEQGRYDAILDALPPGRFAHALEPGCGIGELSWRLAQRCDRVTAFDLAPTAVRRAQRSLRRRLNVDLHVGRLPDDLPPGGPFDLLCVVEVGYYFEPAELRTVVSALVARAAPSATVVACHWTGVSTDHVLPGTTVHDLLADDLDLLGFTTDVGRQDRGTYVLETWRR